MSDKAEIRRVSDYEEIRPLVELCKAGRLFDVQAWIAAGKPVNTPPIPEKGRRSKAPLEIALDLGFHSLIQVLLEAGAVQEPTDGWDSPMSKALTSRRFDIAQLLIQHGFDPKSIDMKQVFDTWDPELMEYFIERGAEMEKGNPLAYALCSRIRTALRILKQYRERFPSFEEQANIALRHHCKEGNLKWVSLMLWAGADPNKPGIENFAQENCSDEDNGLSALGYAALYNHFDVFSLKKVKLDPAQPAMKEVMSYLCEEGGFEILMKLLEKGMDPNDQENGGCSAIDNCLCRMGWTFSIYGDFDDRDTDTSRARESIKAIHLLAKHGAKWKPSDRRAVSHARRSLLKLKPDYAVEFLWIMSKYNASTLDDCQQLISTPAMKRHVSRYRERVTQIMAEWPEESQITTTIARSVAAT
jgi:ankyrin repeat protein